MKVTSLAAAWLACALLLTAQAAPASNADATASAILTQVRSATLSRPLSSIKSIHLSGTAAIFGIHATTDEWDDLRGLRDTTAQTGGALAGSAGWTGTTSWNEDYSGLVTIDGGTSGRLLAADQAYLDNFAFLRPDYAGASVRYAGKKANGGITYDVVSVTPPHGSEVNLWIDPRTHLVARNTATIGIVSSESELSAYRRFDGIMLPTHNVTKTSDGNQFSTTVTSAQINVPVAQHLRIPQSAPHDYDIAGGSTTVPIQVINNHLYLKLRLNGQGPYTFILDTGGDSIVTPQAAGALQTRTSGKAQIGGVGNTTEGAGFTHVDSMQIGGATVRNQYMLVLPIATGFGVAEGVKIDGMIGYQTVARFLTTIDYAHSTMTLAMPPAAPANAPGAAALTFYFDRTIPRIPVLVDGVSTSAEVDTGSRSGLTLSAPFLADHPAIAAQAVTADGVAGFGVGGPSFAKMGRVNTLVIGPYTLQKPITDFTAQRGGAFADPYNPANVGGAIWRRFTVTFDYPHHRMLLAKNAEYGEPFGYDRSGLFLIDNKGAYTIIDARPGTPGAQAGLAKGDVITSVNGAPASDESLSQLRALLSGPVGTVVHLSVHGKSGERSVDLTLRDYV